MREAASCGFWVASRAPHSYKKRSTLEFDEVYCPCCQARLQVGRWMLDIPRVLNEESIASAAQQCA